MNLNCRKYDSYKRALTQKLSFAIHIPKSVSQKQKFEKFSQPYSCILLKNLQNYLNGFFGV